MQMKPGYHHEYCEERWLKYCILLYCFVYPQYLVRFSVCFMACRFVNQKHFSHFKVNDILWYTRGSSFCNFVVVRFFQGFQFFCILFTNVLFETTILILQCPENRRNTKFIRKHEYIRHFSGCCYHVRPMYILLEHI